MLVGGEDDVDLIDAGLVEEGLVPRHERRRLPEGACGPRLVLVAGARVGGVAVEGEDRQPVAQERYAAPLAPTALFLRQFHGNVEDDGDRFALFDGPRQRHDKRGVSVAFVVERYVNEIFQRAGGVSPLMGSRDASMYFNKRDFMDLTSGRRFAEFVTGIDAKNFQRLGHQADGRRPERCSGHGS